MINRIILGTVQLGLEYGIANSSGKPDQLEADNIIRTAWQSGITYFDTALGYGNSESVLGTALRHAARPELAKIITKLPVNLESAEGLFDLVLGSLQRLATEKLYCLMLHREEHLPLLDGAVGTVLRSLQESKKTDHVGVSVYTPEAAMRAIGHDLISVVQIPASLFDRRFEKAGVFEAALEHGKELHIRSVFLQGVLAMEPDNLPEYLKEMKISLAKLQKICVKSDYQPLEGALGWVLKRYPASKIIFGAETASQVAQNVSFTAKCAAMTQDIIDELDSIFPKQSADLLNPALWRR